MTAWRYMRASEEFEQAEEDGRRVTGDTLLSLTGELPRKRKQRQARERAHQRAQKIVDAIADVDVDTTMFGAPND
jgi:hypothetical protein